MYLSNFVNLDDLANLGKKPKKDKTTTKKNVELAQPRDDLIRNDQLFKGPGGKSGQVSKSKLGSLLRGGASKAPNPKLAQISAPISRPSQELATHGQSVMFGISMPQHEAELHKAREVNSALDLQTPFTPSIIVTPAGPLIDTRNNLAVPQAMEQARIASSVYSQIQNGCNRQSHGNTPPLPTYPPRYQERALTANVRKGSVATIIDDEEDADDPEADPRPRSSSQDSRQAILENSPSTTRPQSKGWWNLALTPMLSRKGTLDSQKGPGSDGAPPIPDITTMPGFVNNGIGIDEKAMTEAFSPETPRRIGMAQPWTRWSDWERTVQTKQEEDLETLEKRRDAALADNDECLENAVDVRELISPQHKQRGLAAEYYVACAFDQRSDQPYFECHNHSCIEKLPKLESVFDKRAIGRGAGSRNLFNIEEVPAAAVSTRALEDAPANERKGSESTIIEDDAIDAPRTAEDKQARVNALMGEPLSEQKQAVLAAQQKIKARDAAAEALEGGPSNEKPAPAYEPPTHPAYRAVLPPQQQVSSPGSMSPEGHDAVAPKGAMPMSEVSPYHDPNIRPSATNSSPTPVFFTNNATFPNQLPPREPRAPVNLSDITQSGSIRKKIKSQRQAGEKEDATMKKAGRLWRGRGCIPKNGCFGRKGGAEARTQRRWLFIIGFGLLLVMIAVVVLATKLTRKGDQTPIENQWLNLTGFPPMPTGISTIARPDKSREVTACVKPASLWSCAVPKEDQPGQAPNDADQPNFRFEIRFRNGTIDNNTSTLPVSSKRSYPPTRRSLPKRATDPFTNSLFTPSPPPPTTGDQFFIGNTTDGNISPFDGEPTPFFISFLPTSPTVPHAFNTTSSSSTFSSRLIRRQSNSDNNTLPNDTPAPAIQPDGAAMPANLLPTQPFPISQPLRLYNRGRPTEHYGFYTYYDKSIFMANATFRAFVAANNGTGSSFSDATEKSTDSDASSRGGAARSNADWRCTWSQTRFKVAIWTNARFGGNLLPSVSVQNSTTSKAHSSSSTNSSATNFNRPGSFPYPVTLTIDRHGGQLDKKGIYCYGMGSGQKIIVSQNMLIGEVRDAGGKLVNAVPSIVGKGSDAFNKTAGGVDGGTGGCGCEWKNWIGNGNSGTS